MEEELENNVENKVEKSINNELDKTKQELEETTDRLKRIMAEFENFKKRNSKEREMLYSSLLADIVTAFLPTLDNLEKAANSNTEDTQYKEGINLVLKQFNDVLTSLGVKTIETIGQTFDPEIHEAVSSVQDENLGEKEIKNEFRKGYIIGNKVIRHAMVIVAN